MKTLKDFKGCLTSDTYVHVRETIDYVSVRQRERVEYILVWRPVFGVLKTLSGTNTNEFIQKL